MGMFVTVYCNVQERGTAEREAPCPSSALIGCKYDRQINFSSLNLSLHGEWLYGLSALARRIDLKKPPFELLRQSKDGEKIFSIPDCREMAWNLGRYSPTAMLCADELRQNGFAEKAESWMSRYWFWLEVFFLASTHNGMVILD